MKKTAVIAAFLILIIMSVYIIRIFMTLPDISGIRSGISVSVYKGGDYLGRRQISVSDAAFVRSESLPLHVSGAVIVSEDGRFWSHKGIDPYEIADAAARDLAVGRKKHGASTITQQLMKNVYFSGRKSFGRKIREAITAVRVEQVLSKREILDYYLNSAQFGEGVYGISQAADYYFGKSPAALTVGESALLAFFLPRPVLRGPLYREGRNSGYQEQYVKILMSRMKSQGYIK